MIGLANSYLVAPFLLVAIGLLCYRYLIYPIYLSPLSKIPCAHPSTRISPFWIQWLRYKGRENSEVYAAHQRHGPVILLAPNELSVNCVDNGTNTVYGKSFDKPDYWAQFAIFGHRNQLSSLDSKSHTLRRKRLAKVFAKSYLQNSEDWAAILDSIVRSRLFGLLSSFANKNDTPNIIPVLRSIGVDAVTAYMFGLDNGTNFIQDPVEREKWQQMFIETQEDTYTYNPFFYDLFGFRKWLKKLGIVSSQPKSDTPIVRYGNWGLKLCDAAERTVVNEQESGSSKRGQVPVVYSYMKYAMENEGPPSPEDMAKHLQSNPDLKPDDVESYRRLEIASELIDNINATNATLGTALSFTVWELSKRPELQKLLRSELLSAGFASDQAFDITTIRVLEDLPLLNAITMETLRRHAPVPGVLPRESPHGVSSKLGDYQGIPGGVKVTAYAYSMHRNTEVFPAPETWRPERWLDTTNESGSFTDKERWFWAFGSGVRACSGDVVALQIMKTCIATIYRELSTEIVDDKGLEQIDGTIGEAKDDNLVLRFVRV